MEHIITVARLTKTLTRMCANWRIGRGLFCVACACRTIADCKLLRSVALTRVSTPPARLCTRLRKWPHRRIFALAQLWGHRSGASERGVRKVKFQLATWSKPTHVHYIPCVYVVVECVWSPRPWSESMYCNVKCWSILYTSKIFCAKRSPTYSMCSMRPFLHQNI